MNKQEKEDLKKMCKCGHTKGKHSYIGHCRCLQVMSCKCEGFKEQILKHFGDKLNGN